MDHALAAAAEVRAGVTRMAQRLRSERSTTALSGMKIAVLARLQVDGPATAGVIAAELRQRPQSLTRVFAELAHAGLVTRSTSAADRRASVLAIADAGRRALAADMRERDEWLASAMTTLPAADVQTLLDAAAILRRLCARAPR